ncbi:MAG: nucleotidyltransferase domain-containing protein [Nitrospirota bacterium]
MRFSTVLIDQAINRKRNEDEARRLQCIERLFDILRNLSKSVFFEEAYIFGSVVKPHRYSELSDIDIGFTGLKDEDFFKTMSFISGQIGVEVDIIQLEGHRLVEKIMREGVRWTKKD